MATLREKKQKAEEELKAAREKLRKIEDREALRIGKIALASGLADISISETQLAEEFKKLSERFQKSA